MTPEQEKKLDEISQALGIVSTALAKLHQDQARLLQAAGLNQPPKSKERLPVMERIGAKPRNQSKTH